MSSVRLKNPVLLFPQRMPDPTYPDEMFLIPTSPYACPVCRQLVTLVSPSWLRVTRNARRKKASVVVQPHLPDPCPSCQPEPVDFREYVHRRALLDCGGDQLVYACKGALPPHKKLSGDREVAFTEYFIVAPSPIPHDWAYPHEAVTFPGGTTFHRLWLAITFAYADAPTEVVAIVWRGGRDDTRNAVPVVELDWKLSLSRNRDLLALTTRVDEVSATTVHTRVSFITQLRPYLRNLEPGKKPKRDTFLLDVLNPPISLGTFNNYKRLWGRVTWHDLVREAGESA